MKRGQRLTIHFIAEEIRGRQRVFQRHASAEVLLHLDVSNFFFTLVAAEEHHLNPVLLDTGFL